MSPNTPIIYDQPKAIEKVKDILDSHKPKSILLLIGNNSYKACGAENILEPQLQGYKVSTISGFCKSPRLEDIKKTIKLIKKHHVDFILAVGGGVVMDIAKASSLLYQEEGPFEDYIKGNRKTNGAYITKLLIPTTAGTGAEITPFAVVYIDRIKYSIEHPSMQPNYVILAPELTYSLNQKITAETGCDALAQAIESFWSVNATKKSRQYSEEAIKLILENLIIAANKPNPKRRAAMFRAAHIAGKAISIAKTTAAHALSYPLTEYHDISHGHAVMLTLPYFFPINEHVNKENIQKKDGLKVVHVKDTMKELYLLLGVQNGKEAQDKLIDIMDQVKLRRKLSDFDITEHHLPNIIANGFNPQRVINNPVQITEEIMEDILKKIL